MMTLTSSTLFQELNQAAKGIAGFHLKHLVSIGVLLPTIAEMGRDHISLGAMGVVRTDEGLFYPDQTGDLHLIVPVYERDELVDLCAFRSTDPANWALRSGFGWALGLERGLEPLIGEAEYGEPVHVASTPLEWMRRGARGLCILDWQAAEIRQLLDIPRLTCSSIELADMLRRKLTVRVRLPDISCEEQALAA